MSCLPHWISLGGVADAMRRGRAGRRDRIVDAVDLEPGGERRRSGRRHRLRHRERADALGAVVLRVISAASTMVRVDGPPEPMMMPVRSLEMSLSSRPLSAIACSMATWFHAPPCDRKRSGAAVDQLASGRASARPRPGSGSRARRRISEKLMPDFASRSEAWTSLRCCRWTTRCQGPLRRPVSCRNSFQNSRRFRPQASCFDSPTFRSVAL